MGKQTTRDAALSRLFGNLEEGAAVGDRSAGAADDVLEEGLDASSGGDDDDRVEKGRGAAPDEPGAGAAASGYLGLGRYARADGVVERITPYVRPDQAEALRLAVARKSDPRGTDVSQIIQSLLDEAGYRS